MSARDNRNEKGVRRKGVIKHGVEREKKRGIQKGRRRIMMCGEIRVYKRVTAFASNGMPGSIGNRECE